jgi:cell division protein FtsB
MIKFLPRPPPSLPAPAASPRASRTVLLLRIRQFALTFVPAFIALVVVAYALFGNRGLLRRHELRRQLVEMQADVLRLDEENLRLNREIRMLRDRPAAVRRAAAEELLVAAPGSTIYRFEPKEDSSQASR